jgi:hypothetical protein
LNRKISRRPGRYLFLLPGEFIFQDTSTYSDVINSHGCRHRNGTVLVTYSVKAVKKNKKIKDHKNPDDSSNKALILAFFLFTWVRPLCSPFSQGEIIG